MKIQFLCNISVYLEFEKIDVECQKMKLNSIRSEISSVEERRDSRVIASLFFPF